MNIQEQLIQAAKRRVQMVDATDEYVEALVKEAQEEKEDEE